MTDTELYAKAIAVWGSQAQLLMACEECTELALAIHHYLRGRADQGHIAEEVADVEFMLEQVKALFGSDFIDLVREWRTTKRMRLEGLLAAGGCMDTTCGSCPRLDADPQCPWAKGKPQQAVRP